MTKMLRALILPALVVVHALPSLALAGDPKPPTVRQSDESPVRLVPMVRGGKFAGFKLYVIRPNSPPAKAGFMNGDWVTAIDGAAVTNDEPGVKRLIEIVERKVGGTVTMLRRGAEVKLTVTVST